MSVFRYDKTWYGLLSALFDAYVRRAFPDFLIGSEEPVPMFETELHDVITRSEAAERVWKALERKLGKMACQQLSHVWLSEESGRDTLLMRYMRKAFDTPESIAGNFADKDVLQVHQIARKVAQEKNRIIQFVRFQKAGDGTYFAPVAPEHDVLPLCIGYFIDRFADQNWLLYDTKRHYGYFYDQHEAVEITLEDEGFLADGWLSEEMMAADERLFQERWKSYFQAVTLQERIRPALHRKLLPRRFWKYLPEKR